MLHTKKYRPSVLATVGILLSFLIWTGVLYQAYAAVFLPMDQEILPSVQPGAHSAAPGTKEAELQQWEIQEAYTLRIPALKIKSPVLVPSLTYWDKQQWSLLEEQMQVGMTFGAVAYPHSSLPGENGTLILAGHSSPPHERAKASEFGDMFEDLPDMKMGEKIYVEVGERTIEYRVENVEILPASETTVLKQTSKAHRLKIITCYPVGTTKERLVITAVPAHGPR